VATVRARTAGRKAGAGRPNPTDGTWLVASLADDLADTGPGPGFGVRYLRGNCYWPAEPCRRPRTKAGLCPKHYAAAVKMRRANREAAR